MQVHSAAELTSAHTYTHTHIYTFIYTLLEQSCAADCDKVIGLYLDVIEDMLIIVLCSCLPVSYFICQYRLHYWNKCLFSDNIL